MLKKSILCLALSAVLAPALAADFLVVAPVKGRTSNVTVTLNAYNLPSGIVGQAYLGFDFNNALVVGNDPNFTSSQVTWALTSGSLPSGMQLTSGGVLQGIPTVGGTKTFTVTATYKTKSGAQTYQVPISATLALNSAKLPYARLNKAFSYDMRSLLSSADTSFDRTKATWSLTSGTLPAGLTLTTTGYISGTATEQVTKTFTVTADYFGSPASQSYTLTVPVYAAEYSADPLDFGDVTVNTASTQVVTITSVGTGTLSITSKSVTGTGYTLVSSTCGTSLAPDATCTATIKSAPTDSGSYSGSFKLVTSNGGTFTLPLTTNAVMPLNQVTYATPGTFTWTAPAGVTSVSVVAVGGGSVGGGGLGWKNNIPVVPGTKYTVVVGAGAQANISPLNAGSSYFMSATTVKGGGATGISGGTWLGDGGGNGGKGDANYGGAGAGGYTGKGGDRNQAGAGGGGGGANTENSGGYPAGGGGVGLLGEGPSGAAGSGTTTNRMGKGGSGGANGTAPTYDAGDGGRYGGGGSCASSMCSGGASGAVRIIWPGAVRLFPSTRTADE